ncbi:hypothetical protein PSEEN2579 [Pseudomonas entomophila L48]|uniref:Uncharacterized protein n=1 Tax=Pseudomonas entomophila (strain L48) TaxID=384676 RepID=Q1IAE0_PSEE4|nr:hypothetical protein PSEEN2579 [Pseudomonas entomophila L48]
MQSVVHPLTLAAIYQESSLAAGRSSAGSAPAVGKFADTEFAFTGGQQGHPGDRSQAPKAISSSEEFNSLCPTSAVYMVKGLGDMNSESLQVTRFHGRQ